MSKVGTSSLYGNADIGGALDSHWQLKGGRQSLMFVGARYEQATFGFRLFHKKGNSKQAHDQEHSRGRNP